MYSVVQKEEEDRFRRATTELELEAKWAMAGVRAALERDSANADHDVAQYAAVFRNRMEKVMEVGAVTEAR